MKESQHLFLIYCVAPTASPEGEEERGRGGAGKGKEKKLEHP